VFHCFGKSHLFRYLNEFGFRREHRISVKTLTTAEKEKRVMKPISIIDMLFLLIMRCSGSHLRRTKKWGIQDVEFIKP